MSTATTDELARLRELLLGEERQRIEDLAERLDDPTLRSREVSAVLPQAIIQRNAEANDLSEALEPQIEDALMRAIQDDPVRIANVIFPIIGPAIRRSIRQALADLVQRLNQTVENSLTLNGLRMRLEAARTGVPFAEVVLRRSLLYRVEQLFVIHRETSILLAKAVDEDVATRDPDMVSSMLTVVQGFVQDSLKVEDGDALDSMKVGDLSIWVEPGRQAIVAAVIRGTPPESFRGQLSDLSSNVHLAFGPKLAAFDGDLAPFEGMPHHLEAGLASQRDPDQDGVSPTLLLLLLVLGLLIATVAGSRYLENRELGRLVNALGEEPGIEVTNARRQEGDFWISGLRDPFSADPVGLAAALDMDTTRLRFRWEPFASAAPSLVTARLTELVDLPNGIELAATDRAIEVRGQSSISWLRGFTDRAGLIAPGVAIDVSEWRSASGPADVIGASEIRYPIGSSELGLDGRSVVGEIAQAWRALDGAGEVPILVVRAHLDDVGPPSLNERLRTARAEGVVAELLSLGLAPDRVRIELVEPVDDRLKGRWIGFALVG